EATELLRKYGVYQGSMPLPVGSLKPNDFGLCDMLGNLWCWCQGSSEAYPRGRAGQVVEDQEDDNLEVRDAQTRVHRGGCWQAPAAALQAIGGPSTGRIEALPAERNVGIGFRPARTVIAE